jgi:hypothetical protein
LLISAKRNASNSPASKLAPSRMSSMTCSCLYQGCLQCYTGLRTANIVNNDVMRWPTNMHYCTALLIKQCASCAQGNYCNALSSKNAMLTKNCVLHLYVAARGLWWCWLDGIVTEVLISALQKGTTRQLHLTVGPPKAGCSVHRIKL